MKANSVANLQDILDTQIVWRRKEISTLVSVAKSSDFAGRSGIIRASVPLLYAHWEGFAKECFVRYLEFVSYKRIKFKNLDPAFLLVASLPHLNQIRNSGIRDSLLILKSTLSKYEEVNKESFRKRVETKSNLRYDILCDLMALCGLSYMSFKDDEEFINKHLCDPRNEIAHGSGYSPSLDIFIARRDRAFDLMTKLQSTIVNAAISDTYKAVA